MNNASRAEVISAISALPVYDHAGRRSLEHDVFRLLGFETVINKRGHMMRERGGSHWQSMPMVLSDFHAAIRHTIGDRHDVSDQPLERHWHVREMCELVHPATGTAAWKVSLARSLPRKDHGYTNSRYDAVAVNPAAALVAAWLATGS